MDPLFMALKKFHRGKFEQCTDICSDLLEKNPYDQAAWYLKCRSLTMVNWIDDTDFDEEGVADVIMDENATAQVVLT